MTALLPAIVLSVFVALCASAAFYAPPARGEMAVVFAPGTSEPSAYAQVLEAGGRYVGPSRFSNIVIAFAPDETFGERIRARGALLLLAAQGLCAPAKPTPGTT